MATAKKTAAAKPAKPVSPHPPAKKAATQKPGVEPVAPIGVEPVIRVGGHTLTEGGWTPDKEE